VFVGLSVYVSRYVAEFVIVNNVSGRCQQRLAVNDIFQLIGVLQYMSTAEPHVL
jgi:hypothetical protein